MAILDFILNCACLLVWLNWRSRGFVLGQTAGPALISTLKRAEPLRSDRWLPPAILLLILIVRAVIYWEFGAAAHWTPRLSLTALELHFRTDMLVRMLLFSFLSFVVFAGVFYCCLILVSAVNQNAITNDPWQNLVRLHLGVFERLPGWLKCFLPFLAGFGLWLLAGPLLSMAGVQAPARSARHLFGQAALIGISAWLCWKYAIAFVLILYCASSYVYLGNAPLWTFVNTTARSLLRPLSIVPLRIGRIDFAPLVLIALTFAITEILAPRILPRTYARV